MAKLTVSIYRRSGMPVHPKAKAGREKEFQAYFEKADARWKIEPTNMPKFQRYLAAVDRKLLNRFGQVEDSKLPASPKQWAALVAYYGSDILIRVNAEGKTMLEIQDV